MVTAGVKTVVSMSQSLPCDDASAKPAPMENSIGQRIADLREGLKLSQAELARRAGIAPSYVNKVERGKMDATLRFLEAVAPHLGVEWWELGSSAPVAARPSSDQPAIVVPVERDVAEDGGLNTMGAFNAALPVRLDRGPVKPTKKVVEHAALTHPDATSRWFAVELDEKAASGTDFKPADIIIFRPDDLEVMLDDQLVVVARHEPTFEMRLAHFHPYRRGPYATPFKKGGEFMQIGDEQWEVIAKAVELRRRIDKLTEPDVMEPG